MTNMTELGRRARTASRQLARATTETKNNTLLALADRLLTDRENILAANAKDVMDAKNAGLSPAMIDRLLLNESRLKGIASDLRGVAALPDPVGEVFDSVTMPNGLKIHKQRVPIGVLGIIYEARPNVTVDVAGLALKTGNAAILRGGSETLNSNLVLVTVIRNALDETGLPIDAIQYVEDTNRARVTELLALDEFIDMIIPRGGASLHKYCRENSHIPVITGGIGICHLFVDETADLDAALQIIHNAKTQRPSVCNALDTTLIHRIIASDFVPRLVECLGASGVTFRADPAALSTIHPIPPTVTPAGPHDFDTEWLSLVLGIKVVENLDEAIAHIAAHSTAHSDGILTRNQANAERFVAEVDSAAVYVNASTRFTDGGQFGLGAEVAISTQRLHARGPMGLRELTTYKWVVLGNWHIRP
jgi:glutamate-5-semialdehyde dehydrogenase